ncbi:hypothetical protein CO053_00735 [Candidatus Shapirobacteria bacterium CG_4_9_14_0_2_um_filter_40_11]|uniref:Uncharacterized protein n=1 Tax=Candidatus Shapirobacteria bacterium CG_4_9_14_0_2_um_filter_40_11 TaxID=1974876 RepID=A0A2M8EVM1_9BACT|nr:MAG: hypothetical protein CO053_00735 [Candidatus Shapirobacteria bacterium CG_4_9_14_0_2_um_filter_40_11]
MIKFSHEYQKETRAGFCCRFFFNVNFWRVSDLNNLVLKRNPPFGGWSSDFDQNGKADLKDFSIWKKNCLN